MGFHGPPKDFQECFDPRAVGWGREPMRAAFFAYETEARDTETLLSPSLSWQKKAVLQLTAAVSKRLFFNFGRA